MLVRFPGCSVLFKSLNLVERAQKCIEHSEALLSLVRNPLTKKDAQSVVDRLDLASNNLCAVIDYAEAAVRLSPGTEFSTTARKGADIVFKYMSELNADRRIYTSLVACLDLNSFGGNFLSPEHIAVGKSFQGEFEAIGIALPISQRAALLKLQQKIQSAINRFEADTNGSSMSFFEIIYHRKELAKLLGCKSYADLALKDHVMQNSSNVLSFLSTVQKSIQSDICVPHAKSDGSSGLSFKDCLKILARICEKYFSVRFCLHLENVWGTPWWRLCFRDRNGGLMGDVFISTNFRFGPCHFPILTWRANPTFTTFYGKSKVQTPISMITFGPNNCDDLRFSEIQSLFHEVGHALHTICAKTVLHHLSGTRCKMDFAEIPSSVMELVSSEYKSLPQLFSNETQLLGRFDSWRRSIRHYEKAALAKQLVLARFDQFLHGEMIDAVTNPEQFERVVSTWLRENGTMMGRDAAVLLPNLRSFRHVCTYGASYYCYIFSSQVARQIWDRYMDPDSHAYAPHRFHDQALRFGGSKATKDILTDLELTYMLPT